nr:FAD-binding protein [Candidatus Njordarchaeota archaeon]
MQIREKYDVVIIGGGLGGLTAAHFLARAGAKTLLLELLPKRGMSSHPCGCVVSPVRSYVTLVRQEAGIYFREVGFLFPNDVIVESPKLAMNFIGPDGTRFGMQAQFNEEFPIFQIDKEKVLRLLAERAGTAGAELRYGVHATHLVKADGFIKGVIADDEEIRSRVVISAEGLTRKFSNLACLYSDVPSSCVHTVAVYLDNLELTVDDLGQRGFLGSAYTSLRRAGGFFHSFGPHKGMILLAVITPKEAWPYGKPITYYLAEYISRVPWLNKIYAQGTEVRKAGCRILVQRPKSLVANGFMGVGDTVAPMGHSANMIAMLMGKEAANVAIAALGRGDLSAKSLTSYNRWLRSDLFKGVEFEAKLITSLLNFSDQELNTLCDCLGDIDLEPFFLGSPLQQFWAGLKLILRSKTIKNWQVIRKIL